MPVYTTSVIVQEKGFFDNISYPDMIDLLKNKLNKFNSRIEKTNRNKTIVTVIDQIDYENVNIGDTPALLLRISSYKTNLYNGYFEDETKINFQKNSKIGSDSNFVLFYPKIDGTMPNTYNCYYLMLVYEDPTKESGEVSKLAKMVAQTVLGQPVQNIKIPMILSELRKIGNIPELCIKYFSIENIDTSIEPKYREYLQKCEMKKEEQRRFKDMPIETMEELLANKDDDGLYQKKETTIFNGRTEYKISKKMISDASADMKEVGEKIFNATSAISQDELEHKIYERAFMLEKMTNVITNYIAYDHG